MSDHHSFEKPKFPKNSKGNNLGWTMDSNKSVLRLMEKKKTQKTSKRNEVWQGSGANRRAAL